MVLTGEENKARRKEVRDRPENKAKKKAYGQTPEYKAKRKEYRDTPEYKAKRKAYRDTPEYKAKQRARSQTPEYKAKRKAYKQSEKGKATIKATREKYAQSEHGKTKIKGYASSEKRKLYFKEYYSSGNGKVSLKKFHLSEKGHPARRLKVLQYYSKRLSNSDIPCCRCCGLNSHVKFLDLDHIQGRYEMDSIPELVELGYKSTKKGTVLHNWILNNNYLSDLQTEYFQILCKNCNGAKRDYGKCPMENKPH